MKTPAGRFQMKSWASRSSYRLRFQKYRGSCGKVHVERSQVLNESEDYFEARKAYQQMTKLKMSFFPKISLLFQILLVCQDILKRNAICSIHNDLLGRSEPVALQFTNW